VYSKEDTSRLFNGVKFDVIDTKQLFDVFNESQLDSPEHIVFLAIDNPAKSERCVVLLPCNSHFAYGNGRAIRIALAHSPFSNLHIPYDTQ
jgi:hypothetical protein